MRAAWAGPCRRQRRGRGGSRLRLSPQKEEENRKLEEKRRAEEERQRLEQERRERELREAALREQRHQQQGGEAGPHRCGGAAPTSSPLPRAVPQGRGGGARDRAAALASAPPSRKYEQQEVLSRSGEEQVSLEGQSDARGSLTS